MKSLRNIGLLLAGLFLMMRVSAQSTDDKTDKSTTRQPNGTSTTTTNGNKTKTVTPVRKEKTKTTTHPDGSATTITKSKGTKKKDVTKTK